MNDARLRLSGQERYTRNLARAQVSDLLSLITGDEADLVNYDEVSRRLRARQQIEAGTQWVPVNQIIGSVGRYRDFTRKFLPRAGVSKERWSRIDAAMNGFSGLPPVELYKIGEAYFVRDGNHRVSVARANGATHIEAYVTEVKSPVPLTLDDFERDRWLLKIEHDDFMRYTNLDALRPDHNIQLTEPGNYDRLLNHIQVHHYLMGQERKQRGEDKPFTWQEAVESWYDTVYRPVVEAIERDDLLQSFPGRTKADLYMWIAKHREELSQQYGMAPLSPEMAVHTFAEQHAGSRLRRTVREVRTGLRRALNLRPLGMSDAEFDEARARRASGELSVSEAQTLGKGPA